MDKWESNIHVVTKTTGKYNQQSYATVVCAIQLEWIFFQRVKKDTGQAFEGVEKILQEFFCVVFLLVDQKPSLP